MAEENEVTNGCWDGVHKSLSATQTKIQSCWVTSSSHVRERSHRLGEGIYGATRPHLEAAQQNLEKIGEAAKPQVERLHQSMKNLGDTVGQASQPHVEKAQKSMQKLGETLQPHVQAASRNIQLVGDATVQSTRNVSLATQAATFSAYHAAKKSLSSVGAPPIDAVTGEVIGTDTDPLVTNLGLYIVAAVGVAGFCSAFVSFWIVTQHLVDFASITLLVVSPLVVYQRLQLKALGTLRAQQNRLRRSANNLALENQKLIASNDDIKKEVERLKHVQNKLETVAKNSSTQVDHMVTVVHDFQTVQDKIRQSLEAEVIQRVVTSILNNDQNQDFCLSHNEVLLLEYQLARIPGVDFNEPKFRDFIQRDDGQLAIADVLQVVRHIHDETVPEDEQVFKYQPRKLLGQK